MKYFLGLHDGQWSLVGTSGINSGLKTDFDSESETESIFSSDVGLLLSVLCWHSKCSYMQVFPFDISTKTSLKKSEIHWDLAQKKLP